MAADSATEAPRKSLWVKLWSRPENRWMLGIPLGGLLMLFAGAGALGGVNWVVHQTSSTEFCYGCHSHQSFIKPEYEASSHFSNASGVRASCSDCHLPHDNWFELLYTKAGVSLDVFTELAGKIATREKYEAQRGEMAQTVWIQMLNNDSKFCHSCHSFEAMNLTEQGRIRSRVHSKAMKAGKTCIECHRGIVHALPEHAEQLWDQALTETQH